MVTRGWRASGAIGGAVALLCLWRLAAGGLAHYGSDGAQYIEHFERLKVLGLARDGWLNPLSLLVNADGAYPPLLHLITVAAGLLVGHSATAAAALSVGWLVLLAASVAATARRLGGRGDVAFAAMLLVPAAHGAAVRYYYDLPMTALLWLLVAVALRAPGSRRSAVLMGVAAAAAALVKWAAVPFGVPLVLGALAAAPGDRASKARALAWAAGVAGGLCLAFLLASGVENSFSSMSHVTFGHRPPSWLEPGGGEHPLWLVGSRFGERLSEAGWQGLAFYPVRLVTAVLSPLGALGVLALLVAARGGLRGIGVLAAFTGVGHGLVLLFVLPVWDERFLLAGAPLVPLAVSVAWGRVDGRRWGPALAALGLLLAVDFHAGSEAPWSQPWILLDDGGETLPATTARGIAAASSEELRGWSRADDDRPTRGPFRDALWAAALRCGSRFPAVLSEAEVVDPWGDHVWLQHRALEERLLHGGPVVEPEAICIRDTPLGSAYSHARLDLLITGRAQGLALPPCADPSHWEAAGGVEDPEGGEGAIFWRPRGQPACPSH